MNKKIFVAVVMAIVLAFGISALSFAADNTAAAQKTTTVPAQKAATARPMPPKPNFAMIAGTVTAIDTTDPANVKLEVKNDADGAVHTVSVTPYTNITKVTDISELKSGEQIRMMTRKLDDKDVAMGIMFGKIKMMPPPPSKAIQSPAPVSAAPAAKAKK